MNNPRSRKFLVDLDSFRTWEGRELLADLNSRIIREHGRLRVVEEQIDALKKERDRRLVEDGDSPSMRKHR